MSMTPFSIGFLRAQLLSGQYNSSVVCTFPHAEPRNSFDPRLLPPSELWQSPNTAKIVLICRRFCSCLHGSSLGTQIDYKLILHPHRYASCASWNYKRIPLKLHPNVSPSHWYHNEVYIQMWPFLNNKPAKSTSLYQAIAEKILMNTFEDHFTAHEVIHLRKHAVGSAIISSHITCISCHIIVPVALLLASLRYGHCVTIHIAR